MGGFQKKKFIMFHNFEYWSCTWIFPKIQKKEKRNCGVNHKGIKNNLKKKKPSLSTQV